MSDSPTKEEKVPTKAEALWRECVIFVGRNLPAGSTSELHQKVTVKVCKAMEFLIVERCMHGRPIKNKCGPCDTMERKHGN